MKFKNYFLLRIAIVIFERMEIISAALRNKSMYFSDAIKLIQGGKETIIALRSDDKVKTLIEEIISDGKSLELDEPKIPRKRNLSTRKDDRPETATVFINSQAYFTKMYFEILDATRQGYEDRFEFANFDLIYCMYAEKFLLRKYDQETCSTDGEENNDDEENNEDGTILNEEKIESELKKLYKKIFQVRFFFFTM